MKCYQYQNVKKFSDYQIWDDCELGRGAFGVVKAAQIINTKEIVCVKLFHKDGDILKSVNSKELQLSYQMKGFNHKNLVHILDVFDSLEHDYAYLFMEQCDSNVKDYCKKKRRKFTNEEMKDFMKQITDGYIYLEEHKIIHRDLKPENILIKEVDDELIYKIGDFGCGKILEQTDLTKTEAGTKYYQAPEIGQVQEYDNKCDIYSFGIIIFEMLVGDNTFNSLKNTPLLKEKKFNQIFQKELQGVDHFFVNLLNSMLVYDRFQRISWQGLRQCIQSNQAPIANPANKIKFIRQRTFSECEINQNINSQNNIQPFINHNYFKQFETNKSPKVFQKQPPQQFVPNLNLNNHQRIQTNFAPSQNQPPVQSQPNNQPNFQNFRKEGDISPKIVIIKREPEIGFQPLAPHQGEVQNRGSNRTVCYGANLNNNSPQQLFSAPPQFTNTQNFYNQGTYFNQKK